MSLTKEWINSEKRTNIVQKIQYNAIEYKKAFSKVENICDTNLNIPGCMNQVIRAINDTTGMEFMTEVVDAKNAFNKLQDSITELIDDGVPGIIGLEFSRRVLEESIPNAREYS